MSVTPRPSITNPHALRMMRDRALAAIWQRCRPHLAFLLAIALAFLFCRFGLASEVPSWVLRGIAAVETNSEWRDLGDITYRDQRKGDAGEVGPWQLSPDVLRDLKAYAKRERVHQSPVLAESLTRAWLLHLYGTTGSWDEACAAYHAGLGRRSEDFAIAYAERVRAAGTTAEGCGPSSAAGAAR